MANAWTRGASLLLCCFASLWAGRAEADRGILACTHGADGQYVTFELYSERTASLRGKVDGLEFNCPIEVERIRVCGPNCHIPHDFTVYALLDADRCSSNAPQRLRDMITTRPDVRVAPQGSRMVWRDAMASTCTAFRIDPTFAGSLGIEARNPAAPPDDIAAYVGLYPHEEVAGIAFLDHPRVKAAVSRLTASNGDGDAMRWLDDRAGPRLPVERQGDWLLTSGCQENACPSHHWMLYVAADGSEAKACHADPGGSQEATWYRTGAAPERVAGGCPGQ